MNKVDYKKIAEVIVSEIRRRMKDEGMHVRIGTVVHKDGVTASVALDSSPNPVKMALACSCTDGDRVVVIGERTQFFVVAKIGG